MKLPKNKKWLMAALAILVVAAVPAVSSAGLFSLWWLQQTDPIVDVTFDSVATRHATVCDVYLMNRRIKDIDRIRLVDTIIMADVASGQITFDQLVLTDNDGLNVIIDIDPANLVTNAVGSCFKANAIAVVDDGQTQTDVNCRVKGLIRYRNGLYYLDACLVGGGCFEVDECDLIRTVRLRLKGNVVVPLS